MIYRAVLLLLAASSLSAATFEEMPCNRPGKWESRYRYYYPQQTVEAESAFTITLSEDSKRLVVTGSAKSAQLGNRSFTYSVLLAPDARGRYAYEFTSSDGQKEAGTIEVTSLHSTKTTFAAESGYTVSEYKVEDDGLLVGEEKTYEADGKLLYRATYQNRLLSPDVREPRKESMATAPQPEGEGEK